MTRRGRSTLPLRLLYGPSTARSHYSEIHHRAQPNSLRSSGRQNRSHGGAGEASYEKAHSTKTKLPESERLSRSARKACCPPPQRCSRRGRLCPQRTTRRQAIAFSHFGIHRTGAEPAYRNAIRLRWGGYGLDGYPTSGCLLPRYGWRSGLGVIQHVAANWR
jgi:hypothetical protein